MPLTQPRFRVILADDREVDVQIWNADLVRFDMTRAKHKWPGAEEAPMLWQAFIVWSALRREGAIPADMPWEAFRDESRQITPLNADGSAVKPDEPQTEEEVDPTHAGAALD